MTDRYKLQISRNWRIAEDELQWMLQRCMHIERYSGNRDDSRNWRGRAFCRTRAALLRCVHEHVKLEDDENPALIEAAIARIERFPEMQVQKPEPLAGIEVDGDQDFGQRETVERDVA